MHLIWLDYCLIIHEDCGMKRFFPIFVISLILLACVVFIYHKCKPSSCNEPYIVTEFKSDTIYINDTIKNYFPKPCFICRIDTVRIKDSIMIREQKTYKDSFYMAWVSGYDTHLDSIMIFPKTRTITNTSVTKETVPEYFKKPFGVGIQAGYGYPQGFYVGLGVSYNIINF